MKLFVCMMLVTMVVMATLIDDSEGWRRRRRRRRKGGSLDVDADVDSELREVVEEARSLLEKLDEASEYLNTRELESEEVENILADQEEYETRRNHPCCISG